MPSPRCKTKRNVSSSGSSWSQCARRKSDPRSPTQGRVEAILEHHGTPEVTESTVTSREQLYDELETIWQRGYAKDNGERVEGMRCIGAPILDSSGDILGALSVSGPMSRLEGESFEREIPKAVLSAANVIEVNMAHA
ncbi:IclR family transcriptional regulator C-terminal domain-containing protein [Halobacteria archaeon AArc-dxtr1]|nr:IclR family transcriptional regulator C-terminal domain-containing protein [Halobacteria archaeon AArc-dxtr1]